MEMSWRIGLEHYRQPDEQQGGYLLNRRHHIPDGAYFPYFLFGKNKKSTPHFSCRAICILNFISAINDCGSWVEHPNIFNPEGSRARAVGRAFQHALHRCRDADSPFTG